MVEIVTVNRPDDILRAKSLFQEYSETLGFDLDFQAFDQELESLKEMYAPPHGIILLAKDSERMIGCVALRLFSDQIAEMKRLYVRSDYRGQGVGKKLVESIITFAKNAGYQSIRLDTVPSMKTANILYRRLGFKEIQAYRYNPIPGARYFELALS